MRNLVKTMVILVAAGAMSGAWAEASGHDGVQLWEYGPYWAETNIGAENPWDSGYYFWWGDAVGYYRESGKWVATDGSSSDFSFDAANTLTYGKDDATLYSEGFMASGVLAPEHDAAHVHWGGGWRMSTYQELYDLKNNCDWTWITTNGVNGYVVRGKGAYASASIFLPAAGYGRETSLYKADVYGAYFSSRPESYDVECACSLQISSDSRLLTSFAYRYVGFSVRPVNDKPPEVAAVIAAIDAIGEVAHTDECKAAIDAARAAYDALTDAQKALVTNYDTLVAAEAAYAALAPAHESPAEFTLHSNVTGEVDLSAASVWDGYLRNVKGNIAGTFQVKVGKKNKKNGKSKTTLTLQPIGAKALKVKGEMDESGRFDADGDGTPDLVFGSDAIKGTAGGPLGSYTLDGSRSIFSSKAPADKTAATAALGKWKDAYPTACKDGGGWSAFAVSVSSKGKVSVSGVLAGGTKFAPSMPNGGKVSAKGQLVMGDGTNCITVVSSKTKTPVAFTLWLTQDGVVAEGLGDDVATAKSASNVSDGASLKCDLLDGDITVSVDGKKWSVQSAKEVALKLNYTAKTGVFKGSFKNGKQKATVNGIVVDGKGYGSAVIKNVASAEVTIK